MPDAKVAQKPTYRLANEMRKLLNNSMTNGYSMLSPRVDNQGNVIMTVKDSRITATLTVTIKEDK